MKRYTTENPCDIVMSRDEVRAFDSWAINDLGMPGVVLMENAGRSCAELIIKRLSETDVSSVCIFCGTGNNGGDGYVIARHLSNCGINVRVVICGDRAKIKGDAKINLDIIEGMRVSVEVMDMAEEKIDGQVRKFSEGCDMFVDGLFGTGLKGEPYSEYLRLIRSINSSGIRVVAIDIPSGLDCDSGIPMGDAIKAAATITFVAVKKGFVVCAHSAKYTGDVFVASIGVEPASRKKA